MSKSFPISTKQSNVPSEGVVRVTKTDELESKTKTAAAKRASSIKRKAVPLDFSNLLEPIPEDHKVSKSLKAAKS